MGEKKPTPGPWSVFEHSWCETSITAPGTSNSICLLDINHATEDSQAADEAQMAANARLIAEAGTVFHNTGLSPVQLAEMVKELRTVVKAMVASTEAGLQDCGHVSVDTVDMLDSARAALAKCEGVGNDRA